MLFKNIIKQLEKDIVFCNYDAIKNIEIQEIVDNSKLINSLHNTIFVAILGYKTSGISYIKEAIDKKAQILVAEIINKEEIEKLDILNTYKSQRIVYVNNAREFFSKVTFLLIQDKIPDNIIAVTGTNGKTSTVSMLSQLLLMLEKKVITSGTLGVYINNLKYSDSLTTPNPYCLKKALLSEEGENTNYLIMEASSQGLSQSRLQGLGINIAAFTNLTQDHLDYHGNMDNYFASKKSLFINNSVKNVVLNIDDKYGCKLLEECQKNGIKALTYGLANSDIKIKNINVDLENHLQNVVISYDYKDYDFKFNMLGKYQVYNLCCAIGVLLHLGFKIEDILVNISKLKQVPGRLILLSNNKIGKIFIDYAHTPDAIEEVLKNLRTLNPNKLKILFGCGGDRDQTKRSIMGQKAIKNSDVVYITDDNPRTEDPAKIRRQIIDSINDYIYKNKINDKTIVDCSDRKEAISLAISQLKEDEILLLAGKGHEEMQIIQDKSIHFNEIDICHNVLKQLNRYNYDT